MESTINNPQFEKLQLQKEQMIQRSREADSHEEGQYYLCMADLYTLAINDEKSKMYGSTMTVAVGTDDDAVTKVGIEVRTDFAARTNYFAISFCQWQAIPNKLVREVPDKRFDTAEDAYHFIVGLALKINAFFNNIQL